MAWVYYTAPLAQGTRPTAPQLAELMAAFGERAAFQLNTFWSTTGYGLDPVKQPLLTASRLEGAFVWWTGPGGTIGVPAAGSVCQTLDVALGGAMGNLLFSGFTAPNDWWSGHGGTNGLLEAAAADLGVSWDNALLAMCGPGAAIPGLLNADYFNVLRHAFQLMTDYSFDGATVQTPSWTYP